jgi:hypothetical protein
MRKFLFTDIVAVLFILLFVYAAASKATDYQSFRLQIGKSPVLTNFSNWVAWFIPSVEILIACMLSATQLRLFGFYASLTLMTMFSAYIIAITKFSDFIPCSCGGVLQKMTWNQHFIFNAIFILLAITAIFLEKTSFSKVSFAHQPYH